MCKYDKQGMITQYYIVFLCGIHKTSLFFIDSRVTSSSLASSLSRSSVVPPTTTPVNCEYMYMCVLCIIKKRCIVVTIVVGIYMYVTDQFSTVSSF